MSNSSASCAACNLQRNTASVLGFLMWLAGHGFSDPGDRTCYDPITLILVPLSRVKRQGA